MKSVDVVIEPSAVSDPDLLKSEVADAILKGKATYRRNLKRVTVYEQASFWGLPCYTVRFYLRE